MEEQMKSSQNDLNQSCDENIAIVGEKNISESQKAWLKTALFIAFLALVFYAGIVVGAHSTCIKSGGKLMEGMICMLP